MIKNKQKYIFLIALVLLVIAQFCAQLFWEKNNSITGVIVLCYLSGTILIVLTASVIPDSTSTKSKTKYKIGMLLVLSIFVLTMRIAFIGTVNMGYNGECLAFLWNAEKIYDTGRLMPHSGYLHMGYDADIRQNTIHLENYPGYDIAVNHPVHIFVA
jgi:hypothetical protein